MRLYPLSLTALALGAIAGLYQLYPHSIFASRQLAWTGIALLLLGVMAIAWAALAFRRRHTTLNPFGEPSVLAQTGLYRISRNPMYLGMLLILLGSVLWLGAPLPLIVPPLFAWIVTRRFIAGEEQALQERFGEQYARYRARVRRWI